MSTVRSEPRRLAPVAPLACCALMVVGGHPAGAQIPGFTLPAAVQYTGEIASHAELYGVAGREQRRPSSLGRLSVRSNLELFGAVSVGLDLLISTEGSEFGVAGSDRRQQINQIGIRPEWGWGRAYLGSFTDTYSDLSWGGIRLQGVGAAINPGVVRLGAFAGRHQNAVAGGALDGAYHRDIRGARIGLGRDTPASGGRFIDLVFVRAADDPASLEAPGSGLIPPGSPEAPISNPYAVTPQENVVVSAVSRLPFWSDRLLWLGEVAMSAHSRDRRAPELSDESLEEYSGLLRSLITPRASTYGDVAYTGRLDLRRLDLPGATPRSPRTLTGSVGYRYIGAGYVSLGLASLPADQEAVNANVGVRFRTWSASLQGLRQHDNLLGQKLATTRRNRVGANLSARLAPTVNSSVRASVMTVGNDAEDESNRLDFTSWTVASSHAVSVSRSGSVRSVSLNHTYQQSGDAMPERRSGALRAHDADVRVTLGRAANLSVTPSLGLAFSKLGAQDWTLRHTYAVASHLRGAGGRWSAGTALSNSRLHAGGSVRASLTGRYRVTPEDRVDVSIRTNRVSGLTTAAGGFQEHFMTVGWTRRIR